MTTAMTQTTIPLLEIMNREDPAGNLYPMVEMLARTDQLLMYVDWERCNANLTMKGTRTDTEPSPTDRGYDEGVPGTYGTTEPYEEPTTMIADWINIDMNKLRDRAKKEQFLDGEYQMHFDGFRKAFGDRVFYGDRGTYPKRLRGFTYRSAYNTVAQTYVYDNSGGNASATANKTSAWVIKTGPRHFQFTYPQYDEGSDLPAAPSGAFQGTAMGFSTVDFGMQPISDGTYDFPGYRTYWQWRYGMVVHDPRAIARICNISCSSIDEVDDFSFNHLYLIDVLADFMKYFNDMTNVIIVVPSIVHAHIAKEIDQKSNVFARMDDPFGRPITNYNWNGVQIPICTSDSITETESKVS